MDVSMGMLSQRVILKDGPTLPNPIQPNSALFFERMGCIVNWSLEDKRTPSNMLRAPIVLPSCLFLPRETRSVPPEQKNSIPYF